MDVAIINRMMGLSRGGGEVWDIRMADELADDGISVTFYVGKPIVSELTHPVESHSTVSVTTPHMRDLAYAAPRGIGGVLADLDSFVFSRRVSDRLEDGNHDIIHVSSDPGFARLSDRLEAPMTITMHGPPHSFYHDTLNPWSSSYRLLERFDGVIGTGVTGSRIEARSDIDVETIHPGVDGELFHPNGETVDWTRPTVLFVGRFVPVKDIPELLEAFDIVRETISDAQLVLVGDGPLKRRVRKRCHSLGFADSVIFAGYVPHERIPQYYRGADVTALSSRHESFGMVLLEAMACGTPVVAPQIDYIPALVGDGECGYLYEKGQPSDLAENLVTVLANPDSAVELGVRGRERAVKRYTWENQSKKLYSLFANILNGKSTPGTP